MLNFRSLACAALFFSSAYSSLSFADTYATAKNGYPSASIWVTLYSADKAFGSIRHIADYGCVKSGEYRRFRIVTNEGGSNAYLRSELKQNADCSGSTLSDTTVNSGASVAANSIVYTLLPQQQFPQTYWEQGDHAVGNFTVQDASDPIETSILSRATHDGRLLALGVDLNAAGCLDISVGRCEAILKFYDRNDDSQIWLRQNLGSALVFTNKAAGMVATVNQGNGNRVVLQPSNIWTMHIGRWTVGGNCSTSCALRPIHDDGQNLNAFGGGPYRPGNAVGTWGWGGGGINETWYLSPGL